MSKEAIVIILDAGKTSHRLVDDGAKTFLEKEKECCIKLLQRKIFTGKKDQVCLVLMGTDETHNRLNEDPGGYENISEAIPMGIPNWDMIRMVDRCVTSENSEADWMDALIVAMDIIRSEIKNKANKIGNPKIVLFTTFSSAVNSEHESDVVQCLLQYEIELVVISDSVECEDAEADEPSQAIFSVRPNKLPAQLESELLIFKIIQETNGNLSDFGSVIDHLMNFQRKKTKPWYWYSTLAIGNDLKIEIAATILIKRENHFKFKRAATNENMSLRRDIEHYKNGEKIYPNKEDMIKGFMVGSTAIAYDETLGIKGNNTVKGIRCAAFTKKSNILPQLLCGNGVYLILPKQGNSRSEKLFRLLVKSMYQLDFVMIASRVYLNGSKPKLIVLMPNITTPVPTLTMFELIFADQLLLLYFPRLSTKSSEPSEEQYDAVDKLIDAMDLMNVGEYGREAFPLNKLISPDAENIYDTVTKRAIDPKHKVRTFDGRLEECLKMPEVMMARSAEPLKNVKDLFTLSEVKKPGKKELIRQLCAIPIDSSDTGIDGASSTVAAVDASKEVVEVGTVTPDEDFTTLVRRDSENFSKMCEQMANVLDDLIFKSIIDQNLKIGLAMMTFREEAKSIAPYEYTNWIKQVKVKILNRKKIDFWENVVVENRLGIISISESNLVTSITDEEAEEFYRIGIASATAANDSEGGAEVGDLFSMM